VKVNCGTCGEASPSIDDQYCSFCGADLGKLSLNEELLVKEKKDEENNIIIVNEQEKAIKKSVTWIMVLSIIFIVFGTIFGFVNKSEIDKAKKQMLHLESSYKIPEAINGKHYTVGELRSAMDKEVLIFFLTNYFLGGIMLGLYFWAKKNPFAAIVTALCIYLSVIVLNAIIDPLTIFDGIIVKLIAIPALINGVRVSINTRSRKVA